MAKQQKRPDRVETDGHGSLTDNPFARLGGLGTEGLPEGPAVEKAEPKPEVKTGFRVERTRKGGYPVFLEKRPNGKTVTAVRNVSGDLDALLTRLKKLCGAGGTVSEGAIEIQGDHRERVEAFLREHAEKG